MIQDSTLINQSNYYSNYTLSKDDLCLQVRTGGKIFRIYYHEILYLQSDSNYTYIYWKSGHVLSAKTMKYYGDIILESGRFLKPHRSYIVNKKVIKMLDLSKSKIWLANGDTIPVSKTNRKKIKNHFHSHLLPDL